MADQPVRINKYISERYYCSRREADRLVEAGKVFVNGEKAEPGLKVSISDSVTVNGVPVNNMKQNDPVVIAFNKPKGIVCTVSDNDRAENIIDFIGYKDRIFTVGRLDKLSTGLILLTNRGDLVNSINRSSNFHEKEYIVRCHNRINEDFVKRMGAGVKIRVPLRGKRAGTSADGRAYRFRGEEAENCREVTTRVCEAEYLDDYTFRIVLTQGLNRQIRRMCEALGNSVAELKRIRIMNIRLGDLKEGEYRIIKGEELDDLEKMSGLRTKTQTA